MESTFNNPRINISVHAMDRFSLRASTKWSDSGTDLGIMTWLKGEAMKAYCEILKIIKGNIKVDSCRISRGGVTYVFCSKYDRITLVTVYLGESDKY